jgi:serine/threonine-protein kinase RsbW
VRHPVTRGADSSGAVCSGTEAALQSEELVERAFEIRTLSDPRLLSVIRAVTGQIAHVAGFSSKQIEQIKLAVDEICTNIIRHTYKGDPLQEMVLLYGLSEKGLEIHIQDFGKKVDPRLLQNPRPSSPKPGGLGLSLIRSAVDEIELVAPTAVGNKYRLVKYKTHKET